MAEILKALFLLCDAKCIRSTCTTGCIQSCLQCQGKCVRNLSTCICKGCSKISCKCCMNLCSCTSGSCCAIFDTEFCKSIETSCLSTLSFNNYTAYCSNWFQNCCGMYGSAYQSCGKCFFYCLPYRCWMTVGHNSSKSKVQDKHAAIIGHKTEQEKLNSKLALTEKNLDSSRQLKMEIEDEIIL